MQNFQNVLIAELEKPVMLKNGGGATISPIEAMVKSVMTNAMKGDLASISFINLMTRTADPEKEQESRQKHQERVKAISQQLKDQLENEKCYDGQDIEIEAVAETAALLERLNEIISEPDFQMVSTDMKTGHQTVSPVISLRDKQRDLFQQQLNQLRQEAMKRIITKRNMKI